MVATVGFVAAGLISFPASLGLVMGANVDSTSLGWLVALVGIRLQLSQLMLPLLLLGAGLKLLFLGLASLHVAMVSRGLLLEPGHFDTATSTGRLQLLALGFITTLITHSSGAGVTASPTALSAGALNLGQACALVIGMDMGSSITAQIAAIGSGLSARRTAMAHLLFTVVTAGLAFVLLPPYLQLLAAPSLPASQLEPAFALTLFQSGFNLLGLALLLPLTGPFAALIRQLVRASQEREVDDLDAIPPRNRTKPSSRPPRPCARPSGIWWCIWAGRWGQSRGWCRRGPRASMDCKENSTGLSSISIRSTWRNWRPLRAGACCTCCTAWTICSACMNGWRRNRIGPAPCAAIRPWRICARSSWAW